VVVPRSDNLDAAANSGGGAAYRSHSTLGAMGNVLVFGHRTAHGAVFNQLNNIPVGSGFSLKSANGHWYNYRVVGRHITPPTYRAIAAMANLWPPITAQLVACSTPDFGTGVWHHFAMSFDTATGILRVFIDGKQAQLV
jgi:sortase (surface protein transpeptidase)